MTHPALIDIEPLLESAWGETVPWNDYPHSDWSEASGISGSSHYVSIQDREDGKFAPIYETEQDLARQLGIVRQVIGLNELTESVTTALKVYTFGAGVEISVQAAKNKGSQFPPELLDDVRRIVETFSEQNNLVNNLDVEIHQRSREDGEAILPIDREGNRIVCEPVETVQLTEPRSPRDLYQWIDSQHGIDLESFVSSWSFGILTSKRRTSSAIGYHIVYDSTGTDWDFYPAEQCVHVKRNVPRSAKRGVSDWLAIKDRVVQSSKLVKNMAVAAALQSAIPWIEESPAGTTTAQIQAIGSPGIGPTIATGFGGTRTERSQLYKPGSILRPSHGRIYKPGPMGAERNTGFELIEEILERLIGTRWLMPYYMISGDSDQTSLAGRLAAESPFVKARECDQQFYGGVLKSLLWKVVKYAWKLGWIDTRGIPIDQLEKLIDIKVDFTSPASRDRTALVEQLVKEVGLGVTSVRTASVDLGRDYDEEVAAGAKAADAAAGPNGEQQSSAPGEMAGLSTLQFTRNVKAIRRVLSDFAEDGNRIIAKGLLLGLSVPDEKAEEFLDDAADGSIDSMDLAESLLEGGTFDESKHPRDGGKFSTTAGADGRSKKLTSPRGTTETVPASPMAQQAAAIVGGRIQATKQRAFDGQPVAIKNVLSKQVAGAIGEEVCVQYLKSKGMADAKSLSEHLASTRNNLPADLIQDHQIIEVKAGQASNGPGAQQWRLTIGEPGTKEKAWLAKASPKAKAAFNEKKQVAIQERKKQAIANVSKELGYKVGGKTMTVIINHDTRTADLFQFDGFHDRIGWNSPAAKSAYLGSFKYGR